MFLRPTNLPGKPIRTPTKPETRICPHCNQKFIAVKIPEKDKTLQCPVCGEEIKPKKKK